MEDLDRDEIIALAKANGLVLPPGLNVDLVVAYARVRRLVLNLPTRLPRAQEPAHVFLPEAFLPHGEGARGTATGVTPASKFGNK